MALVTTRDDRLRGQASNLASSWSWRSYAMNSTADLGPDVALAIRGSSPNPHQLPEPTQVNRSSWMGQRSPSGATCSGCLRWYWRQRLHDGGSGVTYPSLAVSVRTSWTGRDANPRR